MNYRFNYTHKIVNFLQEISRIQGELNNSSLSNEQLTEVYQIATVDSVHHSIKIEGNTLTIEQVTEVLNTLNLSKSKKVKFEIKKDRNLKEVINYSKARSFIQSSQITFDIDHMLETHSILMNGIIIKSMRGKLRMVQNVIRDSLTQKIVYMPPEYTDVQNLMNKMMRWLRVELKQSQISPLILSAIFHFQFESIHPFVDGNGRIGRLWSHGILYHSGFDFVKYSAIEKYHEHNRKKYYELLHKFQGMVYYDIPVDLDLTEWIEYWLNGLIETAREALNRINPIVNNGKMEINTENILSEVRFKKAINLFKRFKKLKASEYQDLMGLGRTQAVEDLNILIDSKIIKRIGGGRSTLYVLQK